MPLSSVADFFMTLTTVLFVPFAKFMRRLCSYCCLGFASCRLDFDTPLSSHCSTTITAPFPSRYHLQTPLLYLGSLTLLSTLRAISPSSPPSRPYNPSLRFPPPSFLLFPFPSLRTLTATPFWIVRTNIAVFTAT